MKANHHQNACPSCDRPGALDFTGLNYTKCGGKGDNNTIFAPAEGELPQP
jgi:hypothetical protein